MLTQNVQTDDNALPHICWVGPQFVNQSLALVNRELALALIASQQINLSILPVWNDDTRFANQLSPKYQTIKSYYGRQSLAPIDVTVRHQFPPNPLPPREGHWVLIQPWEYGSLPVSLVQKINAGVDEVWVPSTFVHQVHIRSDVDPSRVQVIPNGVDTNLFKPGMEPYRIPVDKSFKFLFVGGTIYRKGIDLLLQAYLQSFGAKDDVALVIKDVGFYKGENLSDRIRALQSSPHAPAIFYIDQDLSDLEMAQLYNACDCLVLPYRGEGFGIPVLEAMACGRPVVVTAGGATDDFVDSSTGYQIPARKLVFGNRRIQGFETVSDLWMLEPDAAALTKTLVHVFQHREEAQRKGAQARQSALLRWTWKHAAQRVLEQIHILRTKPIARLS
jgi:glycosyltransferase involved in cell wall biosynthesis